MFEKIKERFKKAIEDAKKKQILSQEQIARSFDDDVAIKTQWTPLKQGGANFKTHNLIKVSSSLLKYQLSIGAKVFLGIFAVVGLVALIAGIYQVVGKGISNGWIIVFFGIIFLIIPIFFFKIMGKVTILDRSIGMMYKGNKPPKLSGMQGDGKLVYLNDVHAIQIIKEYIKTDKNSYYSYEINFIMKDATRVNVIDYGNYKQIKIDAIEIALFIGKPLWDATQF